jgi:nicotinamide-nucleotide adenylyltransferase
MLHLVLRNQPKTPGSLRRLEILPIPDVGDGPRWRRAVVDLFGSLDMLVTANRYVRDLMARDYLVVHPVHLVPADRRVAVDGTMVRRAMALGEDWRAMVPAEVAAWLDQKGLVERFLREFGAEYR